MGVVIKVENLSKQYWLGTVGTGTLSHDLNRWWHKIRSKEDPFLKIGETNDRTQKGSSNYAWTLKDVNFEVRQGEAIGIIGRNGAGKSTLLKILSKVTGPTTGKIKIKGRIASLLEVGTGFHHELTGRENIFLNGAILGMSKAEIHSKLDEIVGFAGVERYLDTPVKRYSSGMMVRLAFAIAAHLEPEILIVDEVLAVGDIEFQKKCLGKMNEVANEGRTVLFVSHNMEAVNRLCSRAILLNQGQIVKNDLVENVIKKYLSFENMIGDEKIENRKERIGNGIYQFIDLWYTDSFNNKKAFFKVGDKIKIHAVIKPKKDISFQDKSVFVTFSLLDSSQKRILSLSSALKAYKIPLTGQNIIITWEIEKFQLAPDDYFCDLIMFEQSGGHDMIDFLENASVLKIVEGDFFGSGIIQVKGRDKVFSDFKINYKTL